METFATAALTGVSTNTLFAQDSYPSKPINLIVPYPPGGNNDIVARAYAVPLSKAIGQPVVVDNKGGAAGAIGVGQAAKSASDGYNMVIGDLGTLCINPIANPSLTYVTLRDFIPISTIASVSIVITGRKDLPVNNLREFLNLAKSNPGKYRCGTAGPGSIGHLSLEMIKSMAGVDVLHVPYRGGAPALNDLLGGHIDIMIDGAAFNSAKSGAIKALAVTGARVAAIPEVPTVAESGVTGFYFTNFWGFLMPAKSPSLAVSRIGKEIQKIAASSELRSQLEAGGISVQASTEQEFTELIKRTTEQINRIVKSANITFT
jgi:tripartite-type tricarboxylate transporter receptor subunit TctC